MSWISQTFTQEVILGVTIGVTTSAILAVLAALYRWVLSPLLTQRRERLPNLNGSKWQGFNDDMPASNESTSTLTIKQFGNNITAKVIRSVEEGQREFEYHGSIQSGQILLNFHETIAPGYIIGAMVLHLESDLKTLKGASTYFHHSKGEVVSTFRTYKKVLS
jgi:hypothetical protein